MKKVKLILLLLLIGCGSPNELVFMTPPCDFQEMVDYYTSIGYKLYHAEDNSFDSLIYVKMKK